MILATIVAAVSVTFSPAKPTVGDPVTVTFAAPVQLDQSLEYEIVAQQGTRAVVRTFTPKPIVLSGTSGGTRFRNLQIPVHSVLEPKDDMKPAPLVKPHEIAYPRAPFIAIAVTALLAILAWTAVWMRVHRRVREAVPLIPPEERFRQAVLALRARQDAERWADLADATRAYLATTRQNLGSDLTTTELLPRLRNEETVVVDILRQGDLEKFSIKGAEPLDFDAVASRALELAS
jgi:hypothetical protein